MTAAKKPLRLRSFKDLDRVADLVEARHRYDRDVSTLTGRTTVEADGVADDVLFRRAMRDVTPLKMDVRTLSPCSSPRGPSAADQSADDGKQALRDLIRTGAGFVVAHTSEYIWGTGYGVPRQIIERLHRGDYSIQAHLNLHGLHLPQAEEAFAHFLQEAIATGKRAVLIIHGRGRSSRNRPVLKRKVQEWLSKSRWRKWLIAYASARPCDGGAGATYVLLRQRPCKKGGTPSR